MTEGKFFSYSPRPQIIDGRLSTRPTIFQNMFGYIWYGADNLFLKFSPSLYFILDPPLHITVHIVYIYILSMYALPPGLVTNAPYYLIDYYFRIE